MKGQTGGSRCKKPGGRQRKKGAHLKREAGTRRGGCDKQWGREERKESDETKKMKTVREIAGKPGRMCDERREGETEREREKKEEAMRRRSSAVCFCLHFVSPPLKYSEEKHIQGGAFLNCQGTQCRMGAHV